jgi:hypothetical protein
MKFFSRHLSEFAIMPVLGYGEPVATARVNAESMLGDIVAASSSTPMARSLTNEIIDNEEIYAAGISIGQHRVDPNHGAISSNSESGPFVQQTSEVWIEYKVRYLPLDSDGNPTQWAENSEIFHVPAGGCAECVPNFGLWQHEVATAANLQYGARSWIPEALVHITDPRVSPPPPDNDGRCVELGEQLANLTNMYREGLREFYRADSVNLQDLRDRAIGLKDEVVATLKLATVEGISALGSAVEAYLALANPAIKPWVESTKAALSAFKDATVIIKESNALAQGDDAAFLKGLLPTVSQAISAVKTLDKVDNNMNKGFIKGLGTVDAMIQIKSAIDTGADSVKNFNQYMKLASSLPKQLAKIDGQIAKIQEMQEKRADFIKKLHDQYDEINALNDRIASKCSANRELAGLPLADVLETSREDMELFAPLHSQKLLSVKAKYDPDTSCRCGNEKAVIDRGFAPDEISMPATSLKAVDAGAVASASTVLHNLLDNILTPEVSQLA